MDEETNLIKNTVPETERTDRATTRAFCNFRNDSGEENLQRRDEKEEQRKAICYEVLGANMKHVKCGGNKTVPKPGIELSASRKTEFNKSPGKPSRQTLALSHWNH